MCNSPPICRLVRSQPHTARALRKITASQSTTIPTRKPESSVGHRSCRNRALFCCLVPASPRSASGAGRERAEPIAGQGVPPAPSLPAFLALFFIIIPVRWKEKPCRLSLFRDVTDRKRADRAPVVTADELAHKVREMIVSATSIKKRGFPRGGRDLPVSRSHRSFSSSSHPPFCSMALVRIVRYPRGRARLAAAESGRKEIRANPHNRKEPGCARDIWGDSFHHARLHSCMINAARKGLQSVRQASRNEELPNVVIGGWCVRHPVVARG